MDLQYAGTMVKYLIRDRDSKYACVFDAGLQIRGHWNRHHRHPRPTDELDHGALGTDLQV
ncbi:MAG TPA: hypothetical protein VGD71_08065 [Kribbella sp.]|jgi:hypothetical protein